MLTVTGQIPCYSDVPSGRCSPLRADATLCTRMDQGLFECCEPQVVEDGSVSVVGAWGANASQPWAAQCFVQMDGRKGAGKQLVLYSLLKLQALKVLLPVLAWVAAVSTACRLPLLASASFSLF